MGTTKEIKHPGVITNIDNSGIKVSITAYSACSSCKIKGVCSISDVKDKIVEIPNRGNFSVGQKVQVSMSQTMGFKALFLGYVLPFILVCTTLIGTSIFSGSEVVTGLISLGILAPYYLVLYYFKDKLKNKFSFSVNKLD